MEIYTAHFLAFVINKRTKKSLQPADFRLSLPQTQGALSLVQRTLPLPIKIGKAGGP